MYYGSIGLLLGIFFDERTHIQNKNIILNFQIIQYLSIKYTMVDIIEKASAEVETP